MEKYGYNYEHDDKFYIDTVVAPTYAFSVFASKFVIDFIEKNLETRNYLIDATFDSLPDEFYQLLIIAVEYKNKVSNNILKLLIYKCFILSLNFSQINAINNIFIS